MNLAHGLVALAFLGLNLVPVHGLQCKFKLEGYIYDLCPLIHTSKSLAPSTTSDSRHIHVHQDTSTPPTVTRYTYDINLGGEGLKRDATLPPPEQCPDGTWICMKITNIRPNHPSEPHRITHIIPVAGNIANSTNITSNLAGAPNTRGVNATARLLARKSDDKDELPALLITLNGGSYVSRRKRAVLYFLCDRSVAEPSTPIPSTFNHDTSSPRAALDADSAPDAAPTDTHWFSWRTRHACPSQQAVPTHSHVASRPSPTPHEGEEGEGDEGYIAPGIPLSDDTDTAKRTKFGGIVIGCFVALTLLFYGIYILNTRRKRPYTSLSTDFTTASPFPFISLPFTLPPLPFSLPAFFRPRRKLRPRRYFRAQGGSAYNPLSAEEYEIQDEDSEDGAVVDFQKQALLQGRRTGEAGAAGYGSVR